MQWDDVMFWLCEPWGIGPTTPVEMASNWHAAWKKAHVHCTFGGLFCI
jgi:hypothetical protein